MWAAAPSFGMLRTLHEAYKVAQLGRPLVRPALDAFYLTPRAGRRQGSLGLEDCIGSFDVGKEADFVVLDPNATPLLEPGAMAVARTH